MNRKCLAANCIVLTLLVTFCCNGAAFQLQTVNDKLQFGHAPFWDPVKLSWYYTDLLNLPSAPQLFRYDYLTTKVFSATLAGHTGGVAFLLPIKLSVNQFACGIDLKVVCVQWDGVSTTATQCGDITHIDPAPSNTTLTHFGAGDEKGRLYIKNYNSKLCGDSASECGIYKVQVNGIAKIEIPNLKNPSGMIWNEAINKFYYIDLCSPFINQCIWQPATGELRCRIIQTVNTNASLQSLTVDRLGNLYFFLFNMGVIYKMSPLTGQFTTITLPVPTLAHLAFGGPLLDELFITTGAVILNPADGTTKPSTVAGAGSSIILRGIAAKGFLANKVFKPL